MNSNPNNNLEQKALTLPLYLIAFPDTLISGGYVTATGEFGQETTVACLVAWYKSFDAVPFAV